MFKHIKRGGAAVLAALTAVLLFASAAAAQADGSGAGDGDVDAVNNDSPADAVNVIRDYGLENAPIIIGVIGAIFLVGLTFYLVRRGLMKARGAMRL